MLGILCVAILTANYPSAFSVDIDGKYDGVEWDSAVASKLFDGESNSGVNFGMVQTLIDSKNSALFICFMHKDPSLEADNTVTGVVVSVEDSEYFEVTPVLSPAHADLSEQSFDGFITVDENNGATTEIRVGFKFGLPREISCKVRFIDSCGALSNVYSFSVVNNEYIETTELIITQAEPQTTKKETTAKSVKATTAKKATTKKNSQTEKKKTTAKQTEKTTDDFVISSTPRRYTYVRTTKPHTTKKAETGADTKKNTPASVYYYEKDVIISQVYVSQTDKTTTVNNITDIEETTTALQIQAATSAEPEPEIKSSFSLSEGSKKKVLIGVFAAISFTIIAAAGTRSARKSSDNDENPDSQ